MISPDGRQISGMNQHGKTVIVPASGGDPKELPVPAETFPVQWSADGTALFLEQTESASPVSICRFELATSQCPSWKEIAPADRVGLSHMFSVIIAANGESYAYSYMRILSELFVVDGWN